MSSPSRLQATCERRTAAWARQQDELRAYCPAHRGSSASPAAPCCQQSCHAPTPPLARSIRAVGWTAPHRRPYRPHFSRHGIREGKDQDHMLQIKDRHNSIFFISFLFSKQFFDPLLNNNVNCMNFVYLIKCHFTVHI